MLEKSLSPNTETAQPNQTRQKRLTSMTFGRWFQHILNHCIILLLTVRMITHVYN